MTAVFAVITHITIFNPLTSFTYKDSALPTLNYTADKLDGTLYSKRLRALWERKNRVIPLIGVYVALVFNASYAMDVAFLWYIAIPTIIVCIVLSLIYKTKISPRRGHKIEMAKQVRREILMLQLTEETTQLLEGEVLAIRSVVHPTLGVKLARITIDEINRGTTHTYVAPYMLSTVRSKNEGRPRVAIWSKGGYATNILRTKG